MILYLKDTKTSTKKVLDSINSFSKVASYKINLQKSVTFLHTNDGQIEKEYKKIIAFKTAKKISRNKLNKEYERPLLGKLLAIEERKRRRLQKTERSLNFNWFCLTLFFPSCINFASNLLSSLMG
jgi:hypothetical protein